LKKKKRLREVVTVGDPKRKIGREERGEGTEPSTFAV